MSDAVIAVGAPMRQDSLTPGEGEAWVYSGNIPDWGLDAVLTEPSLDPSPAFGTSVALAGDTLWVGSPESPNGGMIYEYLNVGGAWSASNSFWGGVGDTNANLGASLAVDGITWIAGAPGTV